MNLVLFDDHFRENLLPLSFTRPIAEIRVGILTIADKWSKYLNADVSYLTAPHLVKKYPASLTDQNLFVNAACLPTKELIEEIKSLKFGDVLLDDSGRLVAAYSRDFNFQENEINKKSHSATFINYPEDIFTLNGEELEKDFDLLTEGRKSAKISDTNTIVGNGRIFIEDSATVEGAMLNASSGSIYVGHNAEIMEGALVRGSLALCDGAALKLGAKVYGSATIGPHSKVGGEINNSVILGYSNKGHDGFLGNSVIGEWCNIGADSNNSNLKNNYAEVKLWDYPTGRFRKTGKQFCGLIMGDHSKCGINTMFNTGTVVGVSSNIFGAGFPRNFIPSFAWGGGNGFATYQTNKAFETAELVMQRRGKALDQIERDILMHIFEITKTNRNWDLNK